MAGISAGSETQTPALLFVKRQRVDADEPAPTQDLSAVRRRSLAQTMDVTDPLPVFDASHHGMIVAIAAATRAHVGHYTSETRPRLRFTDEHFAWAAAQQRCLYCGESGPKGPEEHILSVGLGNCFWGLPPDVVCSGCNHGVAARLDQKLQDHPFVALVRTMTNVVGRRGQLASVGASNLKIERESATSLRVTTNHERHASKTKESFDAILNWQNHGPRQRRVTARALLKIGLGALWLARGPREANLACYDHLREAIQDRGDVPLRGGFGNSPFPSSVLQITALSGGAIPGICVALDYFGTRLFALTSGFRGECSEWFLSGEIRQELDLLTHPC